MKKLLSAVVAAMLFASCFMVSSSAADSAVIYDEHICTTHTEAEIAATASDVIWYCSHCGEGRIVLSCRGEHYDGQCFRSGLCSFCHYTQNYLGPCV